MQEQQYRMRWDEVRDRVEDEDRKIRKIAMLLEVLVALTYVAVGGIMILMSLYAVIMFMSSPCAA